MIRIYAIFSIALIGGIDDSVNFLEASPSVNWLVVTVLLSIEVTVLVPILYYSPSSQVVKTPSLNLTSHIIAAFRFFRLMNISGGGSCMSA